MTEDVFAKMEQLGAETVREMISSGHWPANYRALATSWLRLRGVEEFERKSEDRADPVAVAQSSNELARSTAHAAQDATGVARSAEDDISEFRRLAQDADATARVAQSSITLAIEQPELARFVKRPRGDDKRKERIDQPKWHNFLWDKHRDKAIFSLLVLAVMLLIFVLAAPTPPPAPNVVQTAARSTDPNNSPSFDCQKTVDAVHKLICSTPQLAVADRDMAAAYEAVQTSPADTELRNSQWNWLKTRDSSAADISVLAGLYKDRINFLLHYHHAVPLRRPRKPILTNADASSGTKTEEHMDSNPPHACTHEELVQARIARMNEYTGGTNCTNGP
jgi:uncharacterized protein